MSMGMTLLVGLTILFVLYTLYIFISVAIKGCPHETTGVQSAPDAGPEVSRPETPTESPAPAPAPEKTETSGTVETPAPVAEKAMAAAQELPRIKRFRNPETGETASVPTHYRFAKRWIKETLVREGLLERIYRNNELQDEEIDRKVREALEQFKAMSKYWDIDS